MKLIYVTIRIFVGFQWSLIGVQFIAQAIVPDVPEEVEVQLERMEFIVSKVIDKTEDEDQDTVTSFSVDANDPTKNVPTVHKDSLCDFFAKPKGSKMEKKLKYANLPDVALRAYPNSTTSTPNPMNH